MSDILKRARDLVVADEQLVKSLSSWYEADIRLGSEESYDEWLDVKLRHMIEQIEQWYDSAPPAEDIVCALRVNGVGDSLALYEASRLKEWLNTDTACYVEEGFTYASIWISGDYRDVVYDKAHESLDRFKRIGYSGEVLEDPGDQNQLTVCAEIEFPKYLGLVRSGKTPHELFMATA